MKQVLREKEEYSICIEGENFTMYKGDEILITSMSLDKVDIFWDNYMLLIVNDCTTKLERIIHGRGEVTREFENEKGYVYRVKKR